MKITGTGNLDAIKAYSSQLQKNGGKDPKNRQAEADTVEISTRAREMQTIRARLDSIPEVREDKVAALKEQLKEGKYTVDSEKIAAGIAREIALDRRGNYD